MKKNKSRLIPLLIAVSITVVAIAAAALVTTNLMVEVSRLRSELEEKSAELARERIALTDSKTKIRRYQSQLDRSLSQLREGNIEMKLIRSETDSLRSRLNATLRGLQKPVSLPRVDRSVAERGLSDWDEQRWGNKHSSKPQWRVNDLCTLGLGFEQNKSSLLFQSHTILENQHGDTKIVNETRNCKDEPNPYVSRNSTVHDKWQQVMVNDKVLTVDDIVYGYERIFEKRSLYSTVNFMGVALQQDPNDAFVIADMLWRLQPDLVIELGTSGGGSAHFFAHIMKAYSPQAKILTMDPSILKLTGEKPLVNWNFREIRLMCPHCVPANETPIWRNGNIHFLRLDPVDPKAVSVAQAMAANATCVVVIEDSSHTYDMVLANIRAYGRFVTPGSYMLVQDTRGGRWSPAAAVADFLKLPEGSPFEVDRRWEYLVFTQHSGGWLKKKEEGP